MILSRVVVGDPWYANKVDTTRRLPPERAGNKKKHDSVIAKPGPMPGSHSWIADAPGVRSVRQYPGIPCIHCSVYCGRELVTKRVAFLLFQFCVRSFLATCT